MKRISYISLAVALCLTSLSLSAQQNLRSGYFLDGYTYKYKMTPAMAESDNTLSKVKTGSAVAGVGQSGEYYLISYKT